MFRSLVIWWASVPPFARDLAEGAISAGAGAGYGAFQGIDWANPALTPKAVGMIVVSATVGALVAYVRHRIAPAQLSPAPPAAPSP